MWKLVTGEPYAGKSHVRFGGRGGAEPSLPLSGLPQFLTSTQAQQLKVRLLGLSLSNFLD